MTNEVVVTVAGLTGSGKTALLTKIETMLIANGVSVSWPLGSEDRPTMPAELGFVDMQIKDANPQVRLQEINYERQSIEPQFGAGDAQTMLTQLATAFRSKLEELSAPDRTEEAEMSDGFDRAVLSRALWGIFKLARNSGLDVGWVAVPKPTIQQRITRVQKELATRGIRGVGITLNAPLEQGSEGERLQQFLVEQLEVYLAALPAAEAAAGAIAEQLGVSGPTEEGTNGKSAFSQTVSTPTTDHSADPQ